MLCYTPRSFSALSPQVPLMFEVNPVRYQIADLSQRLSLLRGFL